MRIARPRVAFATPTSVLRAHAGQHVALHEPPRPDYVGLICTRTSAANVARNAMYVALPAVCTRVLHAHPSLSQ